MYAQINLIFIFFFQTSKTIFHCVSWIILSLGELILFTKFSKFTNFILRLSKAFMFIIYVIFCENLILYGIFFITYNFI